MKKTKNTIYIDEKSSRFYSNDALEACDMFYITSLKEFCRSNKVDDAKRNAGLVTPDTIERIDNIRYGEHRSRNILDLYRPKNRNELLPVIVSIHGGGWVYGDKGIMQFYCMSLAERGFAVINFNYRLSPHHKHPTSLVDANKVFKWVLKHADEYGLDKENIFAVGDSVGATNLGLYCHACNDENYAKELGIVPPKGFLPRAIGLNCGLYRLDRGKELLIDELACAYLPNGGTDEEFLSLSLDEHLDPKFPPCFILTAVGDFLVVQDEPFIKKLNSLGIENEYHCYGNEENPLRHVFHIDIKLKEATLANDEECAFFKRHMKK